MGYLEIGATPHGEACAQVGSTDYDSAALMRLECRAYINQLRRLYGPEPAGAALVIKTNQHDFGSYKEVAVNYDEENEAAVSYAFLVEEGAEFWDDPAKAELTAAGYPASLLKRD